MEQFIQFLQDRWLMIFVFIIGIVLVVKLVKSLIKWLIIIAAAAALIIYGSSYIGDLKQLAM